MDSFQFELVTPEKLLFSGSVQGVVIPGSEGDFEVLAHHAPVMSTMRPGLISVYDTLSAAPRKLFVRGGFAEVGPAGLTILAERPVAVEELSADRMAAEVAVIEQAVATAPSDEHKSRALEQLGQIRDVQREIA